AGDLLPNPTLDQLIATGFNRCHVTTNEGGTIPEEFYVRNVVDRVETTGQVFMGLTLGCAVCHEHKYDPITQAEFYQLFAFFNNMDGAAMDGNVKDHAPVVHVPTSAQRQRLNELQEALLAARRQRDDRVRRAEPAFAAWTRWQHELLKAGGEMIVRSADPAGLVVHLPLDEPSGNVAENVADKAGQADKADKAPAKAEPPAKPAKAAPKPVKAVNATLRGKLQRVAGARDGALLFSDPESLIDAGKLGAYKRGDAFSFGAWLKSPAASAGAAISKMDQSRNTGYELRVDKLRAEAIFARSTDNLAVIVRTPAGALKADQWHHVFVTYDGSGRASGVAVYIDGQRQPLEVVMDQLGSYDFSTGKPLLLGRRDQVAESAWVGGAIDDVRFYARRLDEAEVAQVALASEMA
ncbi:MAG: DUF1549 domain-containing protein, partial [Planctomycetales bacterium]|nr:DUF1549 domain-containing protein [Planctomycetales bacterium]